MEPSHAFGNVNFDSLLSTTLANYRKTLSDNIFKSRPLLWWLTEKNAVRKLSGGIKIVEPLIYAEGQAGSYGEWDAIQIVPQEGISAAEYPWRQLFASIAISGLEEAQNNGEEAVVNLLRAKVMQAEETRSPSSTRCSTPMARATRARTSWASLPSSGPAGPTSVGSTPPMPPTCGGVRSSSPAPVRRCPAGIPGLLGSAYNSASNGNDVIDGIFTGQVVYEQYESTLTPNIRYQDVKSANAGFTSLMFKQAPIYWDRDCPAQMTYGLNSKYIALVGHSQRWFKQSPFSDGLSADKVAGGGHATTVDARYSIITTYGNLTVNNRSPPLRRQRHPGSDVSHRGPVAPPVPGNESKPDLPRTASGAGAISGPPGGRTAVDCDERSRRSRRLRLAHTLWGEPDTIVTHAWTAGDAEPAPLSGVPYYGGERRRLHLGWHPVPQYERPTHHRRRLGGKRRRRSRD